MQRSEARAAPGLALWGGLECSHVMVRGAIRDQLAETGHLERENDLDRVAELGIRTLRYPLLWAHADRGPVPDFAWHARRFARLEHLGIRPIAGFLHHGSGPGGLAPDDPEFIEALAGYAEAAATRFPHIDLYTPINEPLTTARFAYLYGHWHPHVSDNARFLRAVVASALATVAAMRRIRRVNPAAGLVQTEDFGRVFATAPLADQADYENERRFLFLDLITGRVSRRHRFRRDLEAAGVPAAALDGLVDAPCPPALVGIDYYLTSDRFLDHRRERHPGVVVGGNGRDSYVDVAAVHTPALRPVIGVLARIRELHERYGLPIAVTEVHNGCTREEQLRWLIEAWRDGCAARAEGIALEAITIWSLFGAVDWASLLTDRRGQYESGAFDVRCDPPRPTALARAAEALATDGTYDHPLLARPGWWRMDTEVQGAPLRLSGPQEVVAEMAARCAVRRIATTTGRAGRRPWGELAVSVGDQGLRFAFRPRAGEGLTVEAGPDEDFVHVADAALDLAIDGEAGRLRVAGAGPGGHYRILREGRPPPVGQAATSDLIASSSAGE